jgi:adenylate cyclase
LRESTVQGDTPTGRRAQDKGHRHSEFERLVPLGSRRVGELPKRIQDRIAAEDAASERLIGWVQLALAAMLALLYLVAPKPADAGMALLAPVPATLALYAGVTALRIPLCRRGDLTPRRVCAFIAADILLLIGLIWAIHVQYAQPPAFSLKVPTFVYIFVVIALRALRFDPIYVLTAGVAAALGWIALTLTALLASEPGIVTRSFTDYLTRNAILIGAEVDKVVAILVVTAILAAGIARARRLLVTAVREGAAVREVSRFLSSGVAETIAGASREVVAGTATARNAAIIMLDLRGFTRLTASLPPDQVVAALVAFHAEVVPIVRRHGGVIDKFLGDGVMVTFGAVAPSPTAAADALRALEELIDRAGGATMALGGKWGLDVNGAVTAGPVVFAAIGSDDRLEYTTIGAAVNLAAKLEKHNKAARTRALTTVETYNLAFAQGYRAAGAAARREQNVVAGLEQPIDLIVLRDRSGNGSASEAAFGQRTR